MNDVLIYATWRVNFENTMLSKSQTQKVPHNVWFHLYERCRIGKSTETERLVAARNWEKERMRVTT